MQINHLLRKKSGLLLAIAALSMAPTQSAATSNPLSVGTSQLSAPSLEQTTLYAQASRTRRIQFQRGSSSAVVEDAVVRGTRDTYLLRANSRQRMNVSISSLENNAVFDIIGPNGRVLKQEATSYNGVLPATGDYRVVVGGTRGNASYTLQVSIR